MIQTAFVCWLYKVLSFKDRTKRVQSSDLKNMQPHTLLLFLPLLLWSFFYVLPHPFFSISCLYFKAKTCFPLYFHHNLEESNKVQGSPFFLKHGALPPFFVALLCSNI